MRLLYLATRLFAGVNSPLLYVGRQISALLLALMVVVIMLQVIFRYVLNNALPWPDEAARFMMLWMTGLIAPTAFRRGGFVAIDMFLGMLPSRLASVLSLFLFSVSLLVLIVGLQLGFAHVNSGWLFNSSSLKLSLSWFGMKMFRLKLAWMYMSLLVGVALLLIVNIELILRNIVCLLGGKDNLPEIPDIEMMGGE